MYMKEAMQLNESRDDLAQGVFWIVDMDNMENNKRYCFPIYSTPDGDIISSEYDLNAKSGITYNHEKLWKELGNNKPFNYYPRGRVQISNGKANIYLNPNINYDEVIDFIKDEFKLYKSNGINKINIHSDGSSHYKCYLDEEV